MSLISASNENLFDAVNNIKINQLITNKIETKYHIFDRLIRSKEDISVGFLNYIYSTNDKQYLILGYNTDNENDVGHIYAFDDEKGEFRCLYWICWNNCKIINKLFTSFC